MNIDDIVKVQVQVGDLSYNTMGRNGMIVMKDQDQYLISMSHPEKASIIDQLWISEHDLDVISKEEIEVEEF